MNRLTEELTATQQEVDTQRMEVERLSYELEETEKARDEANEQVAELERRLREAELYSELERLRALEEPSPKSIGM